MRVAGTPVGWNCSKCGGLWILDHDSSGLTTPEGLFEEIQVASDSDSRAGTCPQGHGFLTRAQTHLDGGFYLERCSVCSGVWFDSGEWQRVSAAGLAGGLFEIWTEPWQRAQMEKQAVGAYSKKLQNELGPDVVAKLESLADDLRSHPSRSLALGYFMRLVSGNKHE